MPHPAADAIPSTVNTADPRKRFPRSARVRTRAEYSTVFNGARRVSDPLMTLHWLPADRPARLGLAVSRKVDPKTHKRRNLGTFKTREAAEKHEREVQYFKHH